MAEMEQQNPRGAPVHRSVPGANIVLETETEREERQASNKLRWILSCCKYWWHRCMSRTKHIHHGYHISSLLLKGQSIQIKKTKKNVPLVVFRYLCFEILAYEIPAANPIQWM